LPQAAALLEVLEEGEVDMVHLARMVALALLVVAGFLCLQVEAAERCTASTPISPPSWITSVAVAPNPERVLMVDPIKRVVVEYLPDGSLLAALDQRSQPAFASARPSQIVPTGSGFLLKLTGNKALPFSPTFKTAPGASPISLQADAAGASNHLGPIFEFVESQGNIWGFGSVRGQGRDLGKPGSTDFEVGFFQAPYSNQVGEGRLVLPMSGGEENFYVLGFNTMTVAPDGQVYFLAMTERPAIYRAVLGKSPRVERLAGMPDGFQKLPPLVNRSTGPDSLRAVWAEVAGRTMPAGLYSISRDRLLLITRRPVIASGGVEIEWVGHILDIASRTFRGSLRLPTAATHAQFALGSGIFYVLEKGPVMSWGEQAVLRLLSVPMAWLDRTTGSPLASTESTERHCVAAEP
jgi:hypothetical protein